MTRVKKWLDKAKRSSKARKIAETQSVRELSTPHNDPDTDTDGAVDGGVAVDSIQQSLPATDIVFDMNTKIGSTDYIEPIPVPIPESLQALSQNSFENHCVISANDSNNNNDNDDDIKVETNPRQRRQSLVQFDIEAGLERLSMFSTFVVDVNDFSDLTSEELLQLDDQQQQQQQQQQPMDEFLSPASSCYLTPYSRISDSVTLQSPDDDAYLTPKTALSHRVNTAGRSTSTSLLPMDRSNDHRLQPSNLSKDWDSPSPHPPQLVQHDIQIQQHTTSPVLPDTINLSTAVQTSHGYSSVSRSEPIAIATSTTTSATASSSTSTNTMSSNDVNSSSTTTTTTATVNPMMIQSSSSSANDSSTRRNSSQHTHTTTTTTTSTGNAIGMGRTSERDRFSPEFDHALSQQSDRISDFHHTASKNSSNAPSRSRSGNETGKTCCAIQ